MNNIQVKCFSGLIFSVLYIQMLAAGSQVDTEDLQGQHAIYQNPRILHAGDLIYPVHRSSSFLTSKSGTGISKANSLTYHASGDTIPSDEDLDRLGITNRDHLSAASIRALAWPILGNQWFCEFGTADLKGDLALEEGVTRRDPSALIRENGKYYVWYTKGTGPTQGFGGDVEKDKVFPWDRCDLWYATSSDGWDWKEEGPAVVRGPKGAYDDRSVFTPEVLAHDGKYYLVYQTMQSPYNIRSKNQVGLAWSESPDGPWTKLKEPILKPADNGEWLGDEDNRFQVISKGDFDSHKVHDPCLIYYNDKFYLYYKGEQMGEEITFGGRQIRHGVAIADNPFGPYTKSLYNPISNSGHEVCVWPFSDGVASLITTDGPEKNTVQWAPDGLNFDIRSVIKTAPEAIGLNRTLNDGIDPLSILEWGLTHKYHTRDEQYIRRFFITRKGNYRKDSGN